MNKLTKTTTKWLCLLLALITLTVPLKVFTTQAAGFDAASTAASDSDFVTQSKMDFSNFNLFKFDTARTDWFETITSGNGQTWGTWGEPVYCPPGTYVRGMSQRVESNQGSGDDTALNSVALYCADKTGVIKKPIYPTNGGKWGDWSSAPTCANGKYINGFRLKVESNRSKGDDTALNSVFVTCTDGASFELPNGGSWGTWGQTKTCSANSAVCGVSLRTEPDQGGGDDTAANNLKCHCCKLP